MFAIVFLFERSSSSFMRFVTSWFGGFRVWEMDPYNALAEGFFFLYIDLGPPQMCCFMPIQKSRTTVLSNMWALFMNH